MSPVGAAELHIEQGRSTVWFAYPDHYTPAKYGAVAVRFGSLEIIQGGWSGVNNSRFIGSSYVHRTKGRIFAEFGLGGAYLLKPKTSQLDGNEQFLITVGIGYKFENFFLTGRLRHFSNLNTLGKNHGFEVFLLSGGAEF